MHTGLLFQGLQPLQPGLVPLQHRTEVEGVVAGATTPTAAVRALAARSPSWVLVLHVPASSTTAAL